MSDARRVPGAARLVDDLSGRGVARRPGRTLLVGPYRLLELAREMAKAGLAWVSRHYIPTRKGDFAVKLIVFAAQGTTDAVRGRSRTILQGRPAGSSQRRPRRRGPDAGFPNEPDAREYVEGIDLAGLAVQHGRSPLPMRGYIHQGELGLQMHERGLVHGHMQASNLIVNNTASLIEQRHHDAFRATSLPAAGSIGKIVDFGFGSLYHFESAAPTRPPGWARLLPFC